MAVSSDGIGRRRRYTKAGVCPTLSVVRPLTVTVADVCFCHWPVEAATLSRRVPDWLTVETMDEAAWLTAIPHTVSAISAFDVDLTTPTEAATVRTYVRGPNDQRGLYFFTVVPGAPIAATGATSLLGLPTRRGQHSRRPAKEYNKRRTLDVDGQRVLDLRYSPSDHASPAPPDSLAAFLVERHRYFTEGAIGNQLVGSVGHDPWSLSRVDACVDSLLPSALGLPAPLDDPLVHYSLGTELGVSPPRPVWLA